MKKHLLLIPSLVALAATPFIGLTSCFESEGGGDKPQPTPPGPPEPKYDIELTHLWKDDYDLCHALYGDIVKIDEGEHITFKFDSQKAGFDPKQDNRIYFSFCDWNEDILQNQDVDFEVVCVYVNNVETQQYKLFSYGFFFEKDYAHLIIQNGWSIICEISLNEDVTEYFLCGADD